MTFDGAVGPRCYGDLRGSSPGRDGTAGVGNCVGKGAVLRISFGSFLFFAAHLVALIGGCLRHKSWGPRMPAATMPEDEAGHEMPVDKDDVTVICARSVVTHGRCLRAVMRVAHVRGVHP